MRSVTPKSGAYRSGEQLLERHLNGDREAFPELIRTYRIRVYSYLVRCGVDNASRDDLFQDVFLAIHRGAPSYDLTRPLTPWLFTIVTNKVRDHFRKNARSPLDLLDGGDNDPPSAMSNAYEILEASETAIWLEQAVENLPLRQREAVILCCINNMKQDEAAQALGIPLNTLKSLLRSARLSLVKALLARESHAHKEITQ